MTGRLLDTNAVIALQKSEPGLLAILASDEESFIPATVIGELYYGAYNSGRVSENVKVVDELVAEQTILHCDARTGKLFGQIRHALKTKGRPIPENDIWIAALAKQHDLILITADEHFREVDGLTVQKW
jgi:tRNA(fMet)-specific endonuclease VapC